MASTRLNDGLRVKIVTAICEATFREDIKKADEEMAKVADKFVRKVFAKVISAGRNMPDGFAVDVGEVDGLRTLEVSRCPLGDNFDRWGVDLHHTVPEGEVIRVTRCDVRFKPWMGDLKEWTAVAAAYKRGYDLRHAWQTLKGDCMRVAYSVRTVEKLAELWPDAEPILKPFMGPGALPVSSDDIPLHKLIARAVDNALPAPVAEGEQA